MSALEYQRPGEAAVDPPWLSRLHEDALEPSLEIIDAHHHLWEHQGRPYLLNEFLADVSSGHNIVASVFVECGYHYSSDGPRESWPVGETQCIAALAQQVSQRRSTVRVAAAIVGHADLRLAERVDAIFEAHIAAGGGRFRGTRQIAANGEGMKWEILSPHPPRLLADPDFRRGFARLARYDMSFDAWIYHPQIAELIDLAQAFPETLIVLDHVGGILGFGAFRARRDEIFRSWRNDIQALARCENVFVKLGGLGMGICGFDFHRNPIPPSSGELANAWRPYIETCIAAFGAGRCMFESNFSPDKGSCSYVTLWNAFKRLTIGLSPSERAMLFHDTAARFYRIRCKI